MTINEFVFRLFCDPVALPFIWPATEMLRWLAGIPRVSSLRRIWWPHC